MLKKLIMRAGPALCLIAANNLVTNPSYFKVYCDMPDRKNKRSQNFKSQIS